MCVNCVLGHRFKCVGDGYMQDVSYVPWLWVKFDIRSRYFDLETIKTWFTLTQNFLTRNLHEQIKAHRHTQTQQWNSNIRGERKSDWTKGTSHCSIYVTKSKTAKQTQNMAHAIEQRGGERERANRMAFHFINNRWCMSQRYQSPRIYTHTFIFVSLIFLIFNHITQIWTHSISMFQ